MPSVPNVPRVPEEDPCCPDDEPMLPGEDPCCPEPEPEEDRLPADSPELVEGNEDGGEGDAGGLDVEQALRARTAQSAMRPHRVSRAELRGRTALLVS